MTFLRHNQRSLLHYSSASELFYKKKDSQNKKTLKTKKYCPVPPRFNKHAHLIS